MIKNLRISSSEIDKIANSIRSIKVQASEPN